MAEQDDKTGGSRDELFLPDFCSLPLVFGVVVLAELFALILVLARPGLGGFWAELALVSLFMQWVALWGAAVLCGARRYLVRLGDLGAGLVSWGLLVGLVLLFSEAAWWLAPQFLGPTHFDFILRNLAIGAIVSGIVLRYIYIQHQWRQRLRRESEARIQALQARIRPHFLFNSMNTIAALTRSDPEAAEEAVMDLADLFRGSLGDPTKLIPLADEMELCRRYLAIEKLRLGERLEVAWALDAVPTSTPVPALTLQPLLENAIYHGIEPLTGGGVVRIEGRVEGETAELTIANPKSGQPMAGHRGFQMALENIRERLAAHFGKRGGLVIEETGREYRVTVRVPLG